MSRFRTGTKPGFAALSYSPAGGVRDLRLGRVLAAAGALVALGAVAALSVSSGPAHAAFPGLNGRVACAGDRPEPLPPGSDPTLSRQEIVALAPDGSSEQLLTNNTVTDAQPKYSADGRKIAFTHNGHIHTMNADGTNLRRVTFGTGGHAPGGWSPDGTQIVFQSTRDLDPATGRGQFDVYKVNADGSGLTRLTTDPAEDSLPAWSPDGSKILFNSRRENATAPPDLYTMNPDGSGVTRIMATPFEEAAAQWSPDGRQIVFHTDRDDVAGLPRNLEIYRMNADGSGLTRLTNAPFDGPADRARNFTAFDIFPAWSPEGDRIVFHSGRGREFDTATQFGQFDVFTINATDGSDVRRLTTRPGSDQRCDWQPIPRLGRLSAGQCPAARLGTEGPDTINGTPGHDRLFGLGGNDVMNGVQGNDCLFGGDGNDSLAGSEHNDLLEGDAGNDNLKGGALHDRLDGGPGRDRVIGGAGRDRLDGGAGNDSIDGGQGSNRYSGGAGNDSINAANGRRETVNCGSGRRDTVRADRSDRLRGCEREQIVR